MRGVRDVGLEGWAWSWIRLFKLISEILAGEHWPLAQPRVWFWERQFSAESEAGVIRCVSLQAMMVCINGWV